MGDVFIDRNTDFDGSGSPETATGAIVVTYSGSSGTGPKGVTLMARSGTANYTPVWSSNKLGTYKINLANSMNFYFVAQVPSDASLDLAWV